jgi:diguanylate cyclase (GGDEF)-like protein/PAS domain S-box-containing protein
MSVQGPREGKTVLDLIVDSIGAFIWRGDPRTLSITFVSRGVVDLLGHPVTRWLGGPERWGELIDADDRERVVVCLRSTATDGRDHEVEFHARAADGRTKTLRHAVRLIADASGRTELWGFTTDVTEQTRMREALEVTKKRYRKARVRAEEFRHKALHDALTGLPNRILFDDRLRAALRVAERAGAPCSVLVMDLDRFKDVNDKYGHQAGDIVLRHVALRLRMALRAQDTGARLGGDEFAAVLPNTDLDGATRAAKRILRALESLFPVGDYIGDAGASIGIAVFPGDGSDAEDLLDCADRAMYRAKEKRGGYATARHRHDAERSS